MQKQDIFFYQWKKQWGRYSATTTRLNVKLTNIEKSKIENFAIMTSKKQKYIGQKRMRIKKIIDTIFIKV